MFCFIVGKAGSNNVLWHSLSIPSGTGIHDMVMIDMKEILINMKSIVNIYFEMRRMCISHKADYMVI